MSCLIPSSPNWYFARVSDVNAQGVLAFGSRYQVMLFTVHNQLFLGMRHVFFVPWVMSV